MKSGSDTLAKKEEKQVPIAIIGMSCLFPKADSVHHYWANITNGIDGITAVPESHWQPEDYFSEYVNGQNKADTMRGGFLSPIEFDPLKFGISPRDIEATDTTQLLGLMIASQALNDSGYGDESNYNHSRTSVILGVTGALELVVSLGARLGHPIWKKALADAGVDKVTAEDVVERIGNSYVEWQENSFPGLLGNVAAGRIANRLNLGGTNCVVDAACASSLSALHMASLELACGRSDLVVAGGIDTFNDIFMYTCFNETQALSQSGRIRPFDERADGTILGEGVGIVIVKRLEDAISSNDHIYAVIRGIGSSSDGKGQAIYAPSDRGQIRALKEAYRLARVDPSTSELVETHGTGTKVGDSTEVKALTEVFGSNRHKTPWCALGSVKSQIGHTKAAAGIAGLIKTALALYYRVLPPSINSSNPIAELKNETTPFYLNTRKRPWLTYGDHPRRAGVSAFGFGGSNFHCVLEEHQDNPVIDWDEDIQIVALSANDRDQLCLKLEQMSEKISWRQQRILAANTRRSYNHTSAYRLVMVLENGEKDLNSFIAKALSRLKNSHEEKSWQMSDSLFFSNEQPSGTLAFLFPGQGAQYPGMFLDLVCRFPQMHESLSQANERFIKYHDSDTLSTKLLSDYIYPYPAIADNEGQNMADTRVAQPALAAIENGLSAVLKYFNLIPDCTAGHSFGELVALSTAGYFAANDLYFLSNLRAQLMSESRQSAMIVVPLSAADIQAILDEEKLDLVIANKNTPQQTALSGAENEIERALKLLNEKKIAGKKLADFGGFHSKWMADAQSSFYQALQKIPFHQPLVPVYSNSMAKLYPRASRKSKELLALQITRPVEFIDQIRAMYNVGVRTFIEVGPKQQITTMVRSILGDLRHTSLALDSSGGNQVGMKDLAKVLALCAASGFPVTLENWDPLCKENKESRNGEKSFTVPLTGSNYFNPKPLKVPIKASKASTSETINNLGPTSPEIKGIDDESAETSAWTKRENYKPISNPPPTVAQKLSDATGNCVYNVALQEALNQTQNNISELQQIQARTAELHRQFLVSQNETHRTIQNLINQQQQFFNTSLGFQPDASPKNDQIIPDSTQSLPSVPTIPVPDSTQPLPSIPAVSIPDSTQSLQTVPVESKNHQLEETSSDTGKILLAVVADKTGYPVEMLSMDMNLDTDLGIDSIKRVEILSVLQEKMPDAPAVGPEHLSTIQTLGQIADFLNSENQTVNSIRKEDQFIKTAKPSHDVSTALLEVVADKTGYPIEMLSLDMSLDTDLGIDSIKRVEILSVLQEKMPDAPAVGPEHLSTIQTLGQIVDFLDLKTDQVNPEKAPEKKESLFKMDREENELIERHEIRPIKINNLITRTPLQLANNATVWVTQDGSELAELVVRQLKERGCNPKLIDHKKCLSDKAPQHLEGLLILSPVTGANNGFLKSTFSLIKHTGPGLRSGARNGGAFLATVSRLDGAFGFTGVRTISDPFSGGLAGLSKTVSHEWPEMQCKALDIDNETSCKTLAMKIVDEIFIKEPLEVGISEDKNVALEIYPVSQPSPSTTLNTSKNDVVLISGGARGVTAEAAVALSQSGSSTLVLMGRSPNPQPEEPWLKDLEDEALIKKGLIEKYKKATPKEINAKYRRTMANREILKTLGRIQKSGAQAIYYSIDIRDQKAVKTLVEEIRTTYGSIKGFVHGAGVLADRHIEDKTEQQFDEVYSTKVDGLLSLLEALKDDDLGFMSIFSSTTGRYGRTGQVDYAMANEVINKIAQEQGRKRPTCRVVSFNWGPWEGGMVTPSLKEIFFKEGINLIPLKGGGNFMVNEILNHTTKNVEITVLGAGSKLPTSETESKSKGTLALERNLSVSTWPFLSSHVLNSRAVLPMSFIVELLSHSAIHLNPGLQFSGFVDLTIHSRLAIAKNQDSTIRVRTDKISNVDGTFHVPTYLYSVSKGQELLHASTQIVLDNTIKSTESYGEKVEWQTYPHMDSIYTKDFLFHGHHFQGLKKIIGYTDYSIGGIMTTAPLPKTWISQPLRKHWIGDPLVLDGAFQLMILWGLQQFNLPNLPLSINRYYQYASAFQQDAVEIIAKIIEVKKPYLYADIYFLNSKRDLIAKIDRLSCIMDPGLIDEFSRNEIA